MVFTCIELVGYHFMKHADVFFYLTPRFVRGTMQEGTFLFPFANAWRDCAPGKPTPLPDLPAGA